MRKGDIELLAPAGSYEALIAAVQSGANAIYIGGKQFGARAFANNFDNETIIKAVEYCHLRNVLLYVTVNTLYNDQQFDELIEYINFLYQIGIDAFIVQDMGLFHIIKNCYPDVEIHMSTQSSIRNLEGVQYFQEQNVDRVVLAREMSIEEIRKISHHCQIDLEVFVHGALCMSYSGQCLMSSMIAKRSGNKGKCGQPCRLPYELLEDNKIITHNDKYLLSPKDLCTIEHIGELIESGIKSFKIEGRMKRPEYVYTVISAYRKAIDNYYSHQAINIQNEILKMKQMFNRGFTEGFLFQDSLSLAKSIPGHQGILLGHIHHFDKKSKKLFIQLKNDLSQNDRIYFPKNDFTRTITKLYKNGKLVNKAYQGDIICIELNTKIDLKQEIYKNTDINLINDINKSLKNENIHLPIVMDISGEINKPLKLQISCFEQQITVYSDLIVEKAKKTPLSIERLKQQFNKLGNTIYYAQKINIHFPEDATISIKAVNDLRRHGIESFNQLRLQNHRHISQINLPIIAHKKRGEKKLAIKVTSYKQIENINLDGIDQIFIPFYEYTSYNHKIIPYVPFLYDDHDLKEFMNSSIFKQIQTIMISDFGAFYLMKNQKRIILNSNFNITNSYALNELKTDCLLSLELSKDEINQLKSLNHLYFTAYSKVINMNLKHCIISDHYFDYKNKNCSLCKKHHYQLQDRIKEKFDIMTDRYCNNYILNNRCLYIDKIDDLNVDYILLDFINEKPSLIHQIIKDFQMNILSNNKSHIIQTLDTFRGYYS